MNQQVYNFLKAEAQSDRAKSLASLHLLTNHPAGIGDHSTKDYWGNCNEALRLLASADESTTQKTDVSGLRLSLTPSTTEKCERCWHHSDTVGMHPEHATLCGRCVTNIAGEGEVRHFA